MTIAARTRKILWAESGNCCAICNCELIQSANNRSGHSIIGEECHIRSGQSTGPRFDPDFDSKCVDLYDNLLLLCCNHHRIIDTETDNYTIEELLRIKASHKEWVKSRIHNIKPTTPRLRNVSGKEPEFLVRITEVGQIVNIMSGVAELKTSYEEPQDEKETRLIGDYLEYVTDYMDIWSEISASEQVNVSFELKTIMQELEDSGLWVFYSKELKILEGIDGIVCDWPVVNMQLIHENSSRILILDINQLSNGKE